jgi:signal transduction histidine kinase
VIDNGNGIPLSNFKTVFKPGYSTKARGWGLGLSLAKRIIEGYHRGKIKVLSSRIDKGTTFEIKLKRI